MLTRHRLARCPLGRGFCMKGFDPQYRDLPDYILKCTAMIWEGRSISALNWHYGDDLLVRTPAGTSRGNAAGKANTMATLTEFPDCQLFGEDVIWCGDDDTGFFIMRTASFQRRPTLAARLVLRPDANLRSERLPIRFAVTIAYGMNGLSETMPRLQFS